MSNLALLGSAADIINALADGETVEIALPMGGTVKAVPSMATDQFGNQLYGENGGRLINLHVLTDTKGGRVHTVSQMEEESFTYFIEKARNMVPRLQVMSQRLQLRSGRE